MVPTAEDTLTLKFYFCNKHKIKNRIAKTLLQRGIVELSTFLQMTFLYVESICSIIAIK